MVEVRLYGEIIGYATAIINFFLYLPQVIHVYRVKTTNSLNSSFIVLQMMSCVFTLTYGVIIREAPIIVSSISILVSTIFLGYAKWILYTDENKPLHEENRPIKQYDYDSIV